MTATPMDDAAAASPARGHVAALDGVRGLAILIVLIHNTAYVLAETGLLPIKLLMSATAAGWAGVQLFFVLSGFLITGILADALGRPRFFRTFYIRRTLRIFPLYYAFLITVFVLLPLFREPLEGSEHQVWYWTYLSNWVGVFDLTVRGMSHFWSLAVEEQFYLVWPMLIVLLGVRGLRGLAALILLLTPLIRLWMFDAGLPPSALYEWTIARWDALAAGALLALLMRDGTARPTLARWMPAVAIGTLAGLAVLTLVQHGFRERDVMVQLFGQSLLALASTALIYFAIAPSGAVPRAASAGWLRFLGKYSYAIYVLHFPMHLLAMKYLGSWVNGQDSYARLPRLALYIGLVGTVSVAAAMLSWRLIEKPFLDLKERWAPASAGTSGARATPAAG